MSFIKTIVNWWNTGTIVDKEVETIPVKLNIRQECELLINDLIFIIDQQNNSYDPSKARLITIKCANLNIVEVVNQLKNINGNLTLDNLPTDSSCSIIFTNKILDDLFVIGKVYAEESIIKSFCTEVIKICELTRGYENIPYGREEQIYRMLSSVFVNIKNISLGLIQAFKN